MTYDPSKPLIVQADRTLLLETEHSQFQAAHDAIAPFAELEKSPAYVHSYRISPLSLWNAAAAGLAAEEITWRLIAFARYPVPEQVLADIRELLERWGRLQLTTVEGELRLTADSPALLLELAGHPSIEPLLGPGRGSLARAVHPEHRGLLKQALIALGWPAEDVGGYVSGEPLEIRLRDDLFTLRDYQRTAAEVFYAGGDARGGSGVVTLPPGAGKTIVGLAALALVGQSTLVLTSSRTSVNQWRRELLAKTTLAPEQVAEYTGGAKEIAPVTLATYQMLTYRPAQAGPFPHLRLFTEREWGLVIYDEVHLLPAPIFRATASIQARRRLGLTATLVREDGRESDVFALVGPRKYDRPWRELERRGWIAAALCSEVRVALPEDMRMPYALAERRDQHRISAENPRKLPLVRAILASHRNAPTLIIGQYLSQLRQIADELRAPLITGSTPQRERDRLFDAFRAGAAIAGRHAAPLLVISKVGNFALDLPDAEVLVQVSGTFGSRQEEAQRLGRVLRPKSGGGAFFYSLVTRDTSELEFAHNRQLFLTEQGYSYRIVDEAELAE